MDVVVDTFQLFNAHGHSISTDSEICGFAARTRLLRHRCRRRRRHRSHIISSLIAHLVKRNYQMCLYAMNTATYMACTCVWDDGGNSVGGGGGNIPREKRHRSQWERCNLCLFFFPARKIHCRCLSDCEHICIVFCVASSLCAFAIYHTSSKIAYAEQKHHLRMEANAHPNVFVGFNGN